MIMPTTVEQVVEKLKALPPERLALVEEFIDALQTCEGDEALTRAAMRLSEESLWRVWDNDDDAEYDAL